MEGEEEIEIEYDSDGNPMVPDSVKVCLAPPPWEGGGGGVVDCMTVLAGSKRKIS